jgi:hypothetical protein
VSLIASLVLLAVAVLSLPAKAWNIPGHMLSATVTYQILLQENPPIIEKVKALLEKHPWYANQWQARLQDVPVAERDLVLFMQAARWADDIRTQDRAQNRPSWHWKENWRLSQKVEQGLSGCWTYGVIVHDMRRSTARNYLSWGLKNSWL